MTIQKIMLVRGVPPCFCMIAHVQGEALLQNEDRFGRCGKRVYQPEPENIPGCMRLYVREFREATPAAFMHVMSVRFLDGVGGAIRASSAILN
ncbi:MAG: hypothetical protein K4305_08915 [Chlorobium sp.]|uniref:hypothetical protein n=1 Tax=Chlorobium sp. TaxID=1095 RepID=UPI002F40B806